MSDGSTEVARFAWDEGLRRLRAAGPLIGPRERLVEAVGDELRRRVGRTFSTRDLAAAYSGAEEWFGELAPRVVPKHPELWDPAMALDAAFALYARGARDAQPG